MNEELVRKENKEEGATMVEYVLLAALLAVALIAAIAALKKNVSISFSQTGSAITTTQ